MLLVDLLRRALLWLKKAPRARRALSAGLAFYLISRMFSSSRRKDAASAASAVPWSRFLDDVAEKRVKTAVVDGASGAVRWTTAGGEALAARATALPSGLADKLRAGGAVFGAAVPRRNWARILLTVLPAVYIAAMVGVLWKIWKDSVGNVGKSTGGRRAAAADGTTPGSVRGFDDVAGNSAAKASVVEIVDIIRNPTRYRALGARLPRGLLMCGPPGTGKTLLARCMAAEAKVPFFYCSGSEFVEIFAGRGASRVRNLFRRARLAAKQGGGAIIFVDELDALGKRRSGDFSSNEERDQTLNELLTEMDGFDAGNEAAGHVVVIGATNRHEVLDPALTRPGRLDRIVHVGLPNRADQIAILRVHLRRVPCAAEGLDLEGIVGAGATDGFSGADLANMVNEGAINAVREGAEAVRTEHLESAAWAFKESRGRGDGGGRARGPQEGKMGGFDLNRFFAETMLGAGRDVNA
jgi:cell division protease FtsH